MDFVLPVSGLGVYIKQFNYKLETCTEIKSE